LQWCHRVAVAVHGVDHSVYNGRTNQTIIPNWNEYTVGSQQNVFTVCVGSSKFSGGNSHTNVVNVYLTTRSNALILRNKLTILINDMSVGIDAYLKRRRVNRKNAPLCVYVLRVSRRVLRGLIPQRLTHPGQAKDSIIVVPLSD